VEGVARLKEREGDLAMVGCGELARALVDGGAVDEVWFWVHRPSGEKGNGRFNGGMRTRLELVGSEPNPPGAGRL
jgi:dihydrofolate reductase